MNALPTTGELFATNQVSPDTERCYRYQLRSFSRWMETERGAAEIEDDGIPFEEKIAELSATLYEQFADADKLESTIKKNLGVLGYGE